MVSKEFPLRWICDDVKKLAGGLSHRENSGETAVAIPACECGDGQTAAGLIEAKRSKK
jgi:hypothetical protein